jgi:hypothetical protein
MNEWMTNEWIARRPLASIFFFFLELLLVWRGVAGWRA